MPGSGSETNNFKSRKTFQNQPDLDSQNLTNTEYFVIPTPFSLCRPPRPVTLDLEPAGPTTAVMSADLRTVVAEDTGDNSDDASVAAGTPVLGAPGETPCNPTGPRLGAVNPLAGLSEEQHMLGRVQGGFAS